MALVTGAYHRCFVCGNEAADPDPIGALFRVAEGRIKDINCRIKIHKRGGEAAIGQKEISSGIHCEQHWIQ